VATKDICFECQNTTWVFNTYRGSGSADVHTVIVKMCRHCRPPYVALYGEVRGS